LSICENLRRLKGFDVKARAGNDGTKTGARAFAPHGVFALIGFFLTACAGLPNVGGAPLPPERAEAPPTYRDLADIPSPPRVTPPEMNQNTIQTLTDDRAKTAQAADDLRRQPFDQPDSTSQPGF
jgi:hypothetical protein